MPRFVYVGVLWCASTLAKKTKFPGFLDNGTLFFVVVKSGVGASPVDGISVYRSRTELAENAIGNLVGRSDGRFLVLAVSNGLIVTFQIDESPDKPFLILEDAVVNKDNEYGACYKIGHKVLPSQGNGCSFLFQCNIYRRSIVDKRIRFP